MGVMAYLALWLLIPAHAGQPSILEGWLERSQTIVRQIAAGKMAGDGRERGDVRERHNGDDDVAAKSA
jgi:hypothetical protein